MCIFTYFQESDVRDSNAPIPTRIEGNTVSNGDATPHISRINNYTHKLINVLVKYTLTDAGCVNIFIVNITSLEIVGAATFQTLIS